MTADNGPPLEDGDAVIPLHDESVTVGKQRVERSRVRVTTRVSEREEMVREALEHEEATVTRVPIDREIDAHPGIRQEGDVTVIPLVEEVLVVERRLVLREELHIRKNRRTVEVEQPVTLRSEDAVVERVSIPPAAVRSPKQMTSEE
ncbi:YsnF/AvaK domain-containing protein [Azospirillum sp. YIM B02556]|uniref:YsnF/AvaK domain-containing protein n=1 Tax=Azospirillum endophyticum TaxID=2800326 RepID=A0ABS1FCY3_9PROT|nr:YsnF/AvaK domain-containing protein [Azospirillum endophyticum]MBK1841270.1 YsnF/AvaK domain-containing protein [Azospirillum endophyticum]